MHFFTSFFLKSILELFLEIKWNKWNEKEKYYTPIKKTGTDKKDIIHPSVVISIDKEFYIDDFLKSDNLVEHLTRISKTIISVPKESGFRLTEFVCQIIKTFSVNYLKTNTKQQSYSRTKW